MGFSYGFFNSNGLDRTYTAENFCDYLGSLICNGIQDNYGDCFALSASGLTVTIGTGKAWINGHYFINDTPYTVDLSGYQDLSLPRYVSVSIVCDTSDNVRDVHIEVTAGTPAVEPETVDFNDIPQKIRLRLYNIRLNPSATSLSDYDWFDHRNDENICGYVKCILGKCRVTEVISEFQATATEVQGLRQQVADLAKVETEMQEYIVKTGDLQAKVDSLFHLVGFVVGEEVIDAGKIGDNAYYAICTDGKLQIKGSGDTYSYFENLDNLFKNPSPFKFNQNITSLEISDQITSLGDELFFGTGLISVEIPSTVLSVEDLTFCGCLNLETVHISSKNISNFAFSQCSSLKNVTISTDIQTIGSEIFGDCLMLTSITYEGTLNEWKAVSKADNWFHSSANARPIKEIVCTNGSFVWDSQQEEWKIQQKN